MIKGILSSLPFTSSYVSSLSLDKIARLGNINSCTCVCEVGAGPGALTRSILNNTQGTVVAIEKDKRFLPSLEVLVKLAFTSLCVILYHETCLWWSPLAL